MKIKLRDLTKDQFERWADKNCNGDCKKCVFNLTTCNIQWVDNKEMFSDKFLNQEIEITNILTDKEKNFILDKIRDIHYYVPYIFKDDANILHIIFESSYFKFDNTYPLDENKFFNKLIPNHKYKLNELI